MGTLIVLGLVGAIIYVGTGILFDIFFRRKWKNGNSIQEFRKWAAENWKEIEAAFEEICEKYLEEQREKGTIVLLT